MWSIPLLAEEGWLRSQIKVAKPPNAPQTGASAIARSRNSGQLGEIFRPEQFCRTAIEASPYRARAPRHPGRAVSERIHFVYGEYSPPLRGGEYSTYNISSIYSHLS